MVSSRLRRRDEHQRCARLSPVPDILKPSSTHVNERRAASRNNGRVRTTAGLLVLPCHSPAGPSSRNCPRATGGLFFGGPFFMRNSVRHRALAAHAPLLLRRRCYRVSLRLIRWAWNSTTATLPDRKPCEQPPRWRKTGT